MAEKEGRRFMVSGMVQGVGFRYFVQRKAHSLGLSGYVRNREDGTVEVYAEGSGEDLEALKDHLGRGPSFARVDDVDEERREATGKYGSFRITY